MPSGGKKLMMPDGVKCLDKCVVGCILPAGYSHTFCRENQSFQTKVQWNEACAGALPAD